MDRLLLELPYLRAVTPPEIVDSVAQDPLWSAALLNRMVLRRSWVRGVGWRQDSGSPIVISARLSRYRSLIVITRSTDSLVCVCVWPPGQ